MTNNPWRAITACTPDYVDEATRLAASCVLHNVTLTIYPYKDLGDWCRNCEHTVKVMYDALWEHLGHNIVWLDADCVVASYPLVFDNFSHDIGVYKRANTERYAQRHNDNSGFHYESGAIFFTNNDAIKEFLRDQHKALVEYGNALKSNAITPMRLPDYPSLNHLLRDCNLNIGLLPVAYHYPMNNPQPEEVCDNPVIIQDMVGSSKRRQRR